MYFEEDFSFGKVLDLRDVLQTNCYCSQQAGQEIRSLLQGLGPDGIHHIDSGDYHYLTLFFIEKIKDPFHLLLIDNHPDDQLGAFGGEMLSCGSWVKEARQSVPFMKKDTRVFEISDIPGDDLPIYLSIDLDALSKQEFCTDWDQGEMTFDGLLGIISKLSSKVILGADICGGITEEKGAGPKDLTHNKIIREALTNALVNRERTQQSRPGLHQP